MIRPEAEDDLRNTFQWYEQHKKGLGVDFLKCVNAVFVSLTKSALQYPIVYRNIRRALIRKFPYGIFYICDGQRIVVLAVLHVRRHHRHWHLRN